MAPGDVAVGILDSRCQLSDPDPVLPPILFQPATALFAVSKGADRGIPGGFDRAVVAGKVDPDSFHDYKITTLITPGTDSMPRWLLIVLAAFAGITAIGVFFILALRQEVSLRTSELQESQSAYFSTFMTAVVGIFHIDADGTILRVNPPSL